MSESKNVSSSLACTDSQLVSIEPTHDEISAIEMAYLQAMDPDETNFASTPKGRHLAAYLRRAVLAASATAPAATSLKRGDHDELSARCWTLAQRYAPDSDTQKALVQAALALREPSSATPAATERQEFDEFDSKRPLPEPSAATRSAKPINEAAPPSPTGLPAGSAVVGQTPAGAASPPTSALTELQIDEAIRAACGRHRVLDSYTYEDVHAVVEEAFRRYTPSAIARQEWISVKDRLPADGQSVDIFCIDGNRYTDAVYRANEEYQWRGEDGLGYWEPMGDPTHWMPTPDDPKSEQAVDMDKA